MTPEIAAQVAAILAAAKKATPGPWYAIENDLVGGLTLRTLNQPPSQDTFEEREAAGVPDVADLIVRDEDAAYLALVSPDALLALLPAVWQAATEAAAQVAAQDVRVWLMDKLARHALGELTCTSDDLMALMDKHIEAKLRETWQAATEAAAQVFKFRNVLGEDRCDACCALWDGPHLDHCEVVKIRALTSPFTAPE